MDPGNHGKLPMVQLAGLPSIQPLYMQPVMSTSGAIFTMAMNPPITMRQGIQSLPTSSVTAVNQTVPRASVDLYLCNTSRNATEPPKDENEDGREKASLDILEQSYKDLNTRKIKDTLSSFLPDIPGEFDSTNPPDTMLRQLLDQRPMGGKEFHPLSGQALLGFRLAPGPLPEQYHIDPPSLETKPHHRKRKHKHRSVEKGEDNSDVNKSAPSSKVKMPSDAFTFIKPESHALTATQISSHRDPHAFSTIPPGSTGSMSGMSSTAVQQQGKIFMAGGHVFSQTLVQPTIVTPPVTLVGPGGATTISPGVVNPGGKRKKEKKRNKEKKKKDKEKKKKRERHHNQEPPGPGGPPPPPSSMQPHPQQTYSQYSLQ